MIGEVSQYHWPVERVVEHREDLQQDVWIPVGEAVPVAPIQSLPKLFIGTFNRLCGKLLHKGGVKVIFCVCQIVKNICCIHFGNFLSLCSRGGRTGCGHWKLNEYYPKVR